MKNRLLALDIFRGMTIALMFIVNNQGNGDHAFHLLDHAPWHGCTPTDWVFPFFLFAVGVSACFSLQRYETQHTPRELYFKIIKRGVLIYLIGMGLTLFLNGYVNDFHKIRLLGVLQRIGITYIIASIIAINIGKKALAFLTAGLLLGYWWLLWQFGEVGHQYDLVGNITALIDKAILGEHTWKSGAYDPEGIVSTLGAIATVWVGYLVGGLITATTDYRRLVMRLVSIGLVLMLVGYLWGYVLPINKTLWTSSYVLYNGVICMIYLGILTAITELFAFRAWATPFVWLGENSMLAFVFSGMFGRIMLKTKFYDSEGKIKSLWGYTYQTFYKPYFLNDERWASFFFSVSVMLFLWFLLYICYKKRWILKV